MKNTDISIVKAEASFSFEKFRMPLRLSSGPIDGCQFAEVVVSVRNRIGQEAIGVGGIFLSDLWSFPTALISHEEKESCMIEIVNELVSFINELQQFCDPFQYAKRCTEQLQLIIKSMNEEKNYPVEIPLLLGKVCFSPIDAAIHDGWGKAAGKSCYNMYSAQYLNDDLSSLLGEEWKNIYPSEYLDAVVTKSEIKIQHVVGLDDPLTKQDLVNYAAPNDQLPVALVDWMELERITSIKIKLKGDNIAQDISFITDVYRVATQQLVKQGVDPNELKLALDPNESYKHTLLLEQLLEQLRIDNRDCFAAIEYIEQPTPRDLKKHSYSMETIASYKPVILDESLDDLHVLQVCGQFRWSGIALKTCKGQSHTIAAYCFAKRNHLFVTVQDLTNSGIAFVHSAVLWSKLDLSSDSLEYNSRQYTPFSFENIKEKYPKLFQVQDGKVEVQGISGLGLY